MEHAERRRIIAARRQDSAANVVQNPYTAHLTPYHAANAVWATLRTKQLVEGQWPGDTSALLPIYKAATAYFNAFVMCETGTRWAQGKMLQMPRRVMLRHLAHFRRALRGGGLPKYDATTCHQLAVGMAGYYNVKGV